MRQKYHSAGHEMHVVFSGYLFVFGRRQLMPGQDVTVIHAVQGERVSGSGKYF